MHAWCFSTECLANELNDYIVWTGGALQKLKWLDVHTVSNGVVS